MATDRKKDTKHTVGSMTVEEAGRKGGEKTAKTHGSEFYSRIGRKGGEARAEKREANKINNTNTERNNGK